MSSPDSTERPSRLRHWPAWLLAAAVLAASQPGCVHRRMTIRTNPPGAVAYVDDYEIGTTPVSAPFTYYGTRKIRLVKDGCETLTLLQPIRAPWYQISPLDFVFENLVPGEIDDHRVLEYQLSPQMVVPPDQLRQRAEGLRARSQAAAMAEAPLGEPAALPPPTAVPGGGPAAPPPPGPAAPSVPPSGPPASVSPGPPAGTYPPGAGTPIPYMTPPAGPPAGGYPVHPLP